MAKLKRRIFVAAADNHVPHHNPESETVLKAVVRKLKPDLFVHLGDGLDCGQFSAHPPTYGVQETQFENDVNHVNDYLDHIQEYVKYTAYVEGNHEWRIDRWAAKTAEGRGSYTMLSPRINLSRNRKAFTYIPYGFAGGSHPHYKINHRIMAVHGWSHAKNATQVHLDAAQGKSIIHAHTHRDQSSRTQDIWNTGRSIEARCGGCMCQRVPLYGHSKPVGWTNGFIIGYLGTNSDTMYSININGSHCVLPDGKEVRV